MQIVTSQKFDIHPPIYRNLVEQEPILVCMQECTSMSDQSDR